MRPVAPLLVLLAGASAAPMDGSGRAARSAAADSGDFIVYEAEAGDRLSELAERHFLRPDDWRKARALNGLSDDRLEAGTRIRLDTAWLRRSPLSAEVVAFRGESVILKGSGSIRVARGAVVAEGDRIVTGAVGFVTLRLPDGSELSLPTNSSVHFLRLRSYQLGNMVDRRLLVEQGSLDNKVTPLRRPGHRHEVTTPVSVAAVRGTEFRVSFTPGNATAITEVLEGRVAVHAVGRAEARETLVPAEHGLVVTAAGAGRLEAMLPSPVLEGAGPAFRGSRLVSSVRREPGVAAWRLELATDPAFSDRVAELQSRTGEFDVGDLGPGLYHGRLRAVSRSGIAGRPTTFMITGPGLAAARPAPGQGSGQAGSSDAEVASLGEGPSGLRRVVTDMAAAAEEAAPQFLQLFAGEEGDASEEALAALLSGAGGGASAAGGATGAGGAWSASAGASRSWNAGPFASGGSPGRWVLPGAGPGPMRPAPFAFPVVWPVPPVEESIGQVPGAILSGLEPVPPPAVALAPAGAPFRAAPASGAALVPEAEIWVMLILGFGSVGLALRRRRGRGCQAQARHALGPAG